MNKIELLQDMLQSSPQDSRLNYLLALEYKSLGQGDHAQNYFKAALLNADLEFSKEILAAMDTQNEPAREGDILPEHSTDIQNDSNEAHDSKLKVVKGNVVDFRKIEAEEPDEKTIKFSDVGGLDDLKKTITMKIIKPFLEPGLFKQFKKKSGGGILLYGPPGCGKTFIAKATAGECNAHFRPVHISDVLDPYFGQSAINMHEIFLVAHSKKPCILFFDEIDTLGYSRSKTTSDMMRSVVDQMLSDIEGVDTDTDRILIIGATNMPWDVDSALRRPGRFDKTIFVPPPDQSAREAIFKLKLKGRPTEAIDYQKLAAKAELYSGADIENVVEIATENVLTDIITSGNNDRKITNNDIFEVLLQSTPSTLEWLRTVANYVKYSNQSGVYDDVEKFLKQNKRFLF